MLSAFHTQYPFERRKAECDRILKKYPDKIPTIIQLNNGSKLPKLKDRKFLFPDDFTMAQILFSVRRRMNLAPEQALFTFVNNTLHSGSQLVGEIYKKSKDPDGFLYIICDTENTFGALAPNTFSALALNTFG